MRGKNASKCIFILDYFFPIIFLTPKVLFLPLPVFKKKKKKKLIEFEDSWSIFYVGVVCKMWDNSAELSGHHQ